MFPAQARLRISSLKLSSLLRQFRIEPDSTGSTGLVCEWNPRLTRLARAESTRANNGDGLSIMNDDIRYKAAEAVVALAHRTESAGKKLSAAAKGKAWVTMPHVPGYSMNPDKLREAAAYYEIAESINRSAAGWGYPRAMLLESMGDYTQAIAVFETLAGTLYEQPGKQGVSRCVKKRAGTYRIEDDFSADDRSDPDQDGADAELLPGADLKSLMSYLQSADAPTPKSGKDQPAANADSDAVRQAAIDTAQVFVNLLLDQNYPAAQAMLHPHDSGMTAEELQEGFSAMFEGEPFPESAQVFDVQTDMPQLELDDLAWVYVTIHSENMEAVSLIVAKAGKRLVVRDVEFGRP